MTFPNPRYSYRNLVGIYRVSEIYIVCLIGMKHGWTDGTKKRWSRLFVYAIVLLFLPRRLNLRFRNLYYMNLILKTIKVDIEKSVPAQVRGNNHWAWYD
jgi:hypothetical protein